MAGKTKIGWCDFTVNPRLARCKHVAPECDNCYAEQQVNRWQGPGAFTSGPPTLKPGRLILPFTDPDMRAGYRGFLDSMSDPFYPMEAPQQALIWAMMALDPGHEYQVLTKRPEPGLKLLGDPEFPGMVQAAFPALLKMLTPPSGRMGPVRRAAVEGAEKAAEEFVWPLRNVIVGVSAGSQDTADKFLPTLAKIPAAYRMLSWEPALGATDLTPYLPFLDWVIAGGESGRVCVDAPFDPPPGAGYARPMEIGDLFDVVTQCRDADVPVFVKQLGSVQAKRFGLDDFKGEDWQEWPDRLSSLKIREFTRR